MAGQIDKGSVISEKEILDALNKVSKGFRGLDKDVLQLVDSTQKLDKETKEFAGTQKEIATNSKKLADNVTKLTELEKKQIRIKEDLKRAIKKERDEAKQLAIINDKQAGTLEKLIAKNKLLEIQKRKLTSTGAKLRAETLAYNRQIDRNNKIIKANRASSQGLTNSLRTLGKQFLAVTGLAAGAGIVIRKIGQLFKTAAEDVRLFEETFTNVLTLLDEAQKKQFGKILEQGTIDLMGAYGLEIREVNEALFDAISAGIPAGVAIQFLEKSTRLAIAGNSTLTAVVDGATTTIESYKGQAISTTEILNAFFAAQVKGKTDVELVATSIGEVASTAATAKIPVSELFGVFAGLTKFLGGTEKSATALVNVINAIIKPSEKAKTVFADLGIETGITAVQQDGLLNKLLEVAAAYEGNNDVLADLIPNIRAFKGIAGLNAEAIAEIGQNVIDLNDAEKSAALVQGAFNEQIETGAREAKIAKSAWKELTITVGGGESIFKRIGGFFRNVLIKIFEQLTKTAKAFRVAIAAVFDVFRKEGEKRAQKILDTYRGINDNIVEDTKETTIELTTEEAERQRKLDEIRRKAAALRTAEEKALLKAELKRKAAIEKQFREDDIRAEQDTIDFLFALELEHEQRITDHLLEQINERDRLLEENRKKREKEREEEIEKDIKLQEDLWNAKANIATAGTEFINTLFDRQLQAFEKQKEQELEVAGDNEAAREKIEEKFAKKQNALLIAQAIASKLNALFNIKISTAAAVAKALPNPILVGFAKALGILQALTVAAAPIPQFWKGVKGFQGGMADVGERGREMIKTPNGSFMSPDQRTRMYLPPGTDVIPNPETEKQIEKGSQELRELAASNRQMARSIKEKPIINNNITSSGIDYVVQRGQSHTHYMDKYFRK
ncbi:phage tail tape measure protein [Candidatus Pacearchaeota archaeon]|nr:phage tail tape measure protein [Candidatus Pacearchaeota archaeon]